MTIFDWVNQILVTKRPWDSFKEDEQKKFSPFIINRFLSMDKDFIEVVNLFQKYSIGLLEPREVYKWYCDFLPRGKRYNKYIKGKRYKKYNDSLLELLCRYFEVGKRDVYNYIPLMKKEEIINIVKLYGIDDKKMKEMVK